MPFSDFFQLGFSWPVWLAVFGVLLILSLLVLISLARRPKVMELLTRFLMQEPTLKSRLLIGFRFVAAVPVLTLLPLLAVISTTTVQNAQLPQIERLAASIATSVPQLVQSRITGIESLAGDITVAGNSDGNILTGTLLRHHVSNREFASLWVARFDGDVVAASAIKGGQVKPWVGPVSGVAMMDSFKRAVTADGLYVSPVKKGAATEATPMIFISVPVRLHGDEHWGFIQGLLNLQELVRGLVDQGSIDSVSVIITDNMNRVILASPGLALVPFSDLSAHPLMTKEPADNSDKPYSFNGIVNNDGSAGRYVAVSRPLENGWQVYATATQAKADTTVLIFMALGLLWALLALNIAGKLAPLYGEVVSDPLQKLEESLDVFDAARTITIIPPASEDIPVEIRQTYARVRKSMESSREAYRNMLKVVQEGMELRKELGKAKEKINEETGTSNRLTAANRLPGKPDISLASEASETQETWNDRIDEVTGLPGREVFEGFFGEAWTLGITDSRPLSLVITRIVASDEQTLKLFAEQLRSTAGRTLDLVARISEKAFVMVLPDTDLNGSLAVANRLRETFCDELADRAEICFGVASIVPNENGSPKAFFDLCQRAMAAARQKGNDKIVYVSDTGKLTLFSNADLIDWDPAEELSA